MEDFYFNESDLINGRLFIAGAKPGDFVVINGNGELCFPEITAVTDAVNGTNVYFDKSYDFGSDYKIKFIASSSGSSGSSNRIVQYSESEDGEWHDTLGENDRYMRFSSDGGVTWTKPIAIGSTSSGSSNRIVQYSESEDGEWHDTLGENDRYMRFSSDGGVTWTKPIAIGSTGSSNTEFDGELIHNFIEPISSGSTAIDTIVNELVYPEMWMFCEIMVHHETAQKGGDGNFHFTYHHWNRAWHPQVFLNGSDIQLDDSLYEVNYVDGYIIPLWTVSPADTLMCTYNFTWFKPETLISFVKRSMGSINYRGSGQPTDYTVDTMPQSWHGISADLVVAMMCEHLILSQTMWYGKLIFAISANDLYNGGGSDIASNLESMKRNAEDRAYAALDNENMRAPAHLSKPTPAYWRAVTMGNGVRPGPHGQLGYGKQKGIKYNKMVGMTGPDLGI